MGSVKMETRNEGRGQKEWSYLPLCEERTVAKQIKERSKLDPTFYPSQTNAGIFSTDGVNLGGEPIICTYIDLEMLIDGCSFSQREKSILDDLMYGYTSQDIADRLSVTRQTVDVMFKRAVKKIVEENNRRWNAVYSVHART